MIEKKIYIVLIFIFLIFFIFMFLFFGIDFMRQKSYQFTLIIGDTSVFSYKNQKWQSLKPYTFQTLNWQNFEVYENHQRLGEYSLWHDDKWYVFDNNKNAVLFDGDLFAYQANYDFKVLDFQTMDIQNPTYIDLVLQENQLDLSSEFTSAYQVSFDFDSDGTTEDFYVISNVFPLDFDPEVIFSIVFMVKDNTIYPIYQDISANHSFNGCKPFFHSFFDMNEDGVYEFVLSCGKYSVSEQIDTLYQFNQGEFKTVVSNQ